MVDHHELQTTIAETLTKSAISSIELVFKCSLNFAVRLTAFPGGRQNPDAQPSLYPFEVALQSLDIEALVDHLLDAGRSLEKARIELEGVRYPRWTRVAERSRLNADP